ncbi:hypothetical protein [Absidia glauca]|uniref:C2H2-type domain-containing protein n=1 Tax=Absidia glauca TaxID=4829 RepID=A0A163J3H0_ABSGL|nr:hypothetical protein [Absidia glauca]
MAKEPKLVRIQHLCFECPTLFTKPQSLRNHLRRHGIELPQNRTGIRRYDTEDVIFVKTLSNHPIVATHLGCPACIVHCADVAELKTHYIDHHADKLSVQYSQSKSILPLASSPPPLSPSSQQLVVDAEETDCNYP